MNEDNRVSPEKDKPVQAQAPGAESISSQPDAEVVIEVSRNELEAHLTLRPLKASPRMTVAEIRRALANKEITRGIKEAVLQDLEKEMKYNESIFIAFGTPPVPGLDGAVKLYSEGRETVKVKKSDRIGEIVPPRNGVEGVTVLGKKVPFPELKKARVPKLQNVKFSAENANILVADIDGYLTLEEDSLEVTPFFELEKSGNECEAFVRVKKRLKEEDFGREDLKEFLKENKIIYGILEDELDNIFKQEKYDQPLKVAEGTLVVNGKNGEIKYYFETVLKPREDGQGRVDYKELNLIQNVKAGDKLAESMVPEPGKEGCTIYGKKTQPKQGVRPPLPAGENTRLAPGDSNLLLAEIAGSVRLKGKSIMVEPVIVIKEDVDYNTGNIDFDGAVMISGDVLSGFRVKATGDIQIEGVVEDAEIECGGNVLLKTGFIGKGHGRLRATGNVTAKYCVNETIQCEGDLYIDEYLMHSQVQARGSLFIKENKGLIVGGEIYAVKGIEAKVAGNESFTQTALFAGIDKQEIEEIDNKKAALQTNISHLAEIDRTMVKLIRLQLIRRTLPGDKQSLGDKLKQVKELKQNEIKKLSAEIEALQQKAEQYKTSVVKIYDCVYPETTVTICNRHFKVEEPLKYVYFKYSAEEVLAADMQELE